LLALAVISDRLHALDAGPANFQFIGQAPEV
jgi:hypothetical protein